MGEREIMAKLRCLLGANASYEIDASAPTPAERRRIEKTMDEAAADAAEAEIEMESLLPRNHVTFDAYYPRARSKYLARKALAEGLSARTMRRRVRVGRRNKSGFKLIAQGDGWNEVFAKLRKKSVG
ncbi:MAG TPA: hypothetical protein VF292_06660 [Rhodanobacteraceae bacterium]